MSDNAHALLPGSAERATREADLAKQEAELFAEIAHRRKIRIAIALGVVVAAVLIWFGVEVTRRLLARAEVWAELAKIRERGEPLTMADLQLPTVPDDDNAAVLLVKAHTLFVKTERENGRLHAMREPLSGLLRICSKEELLAKATAADKDVVRDVREALTRRGFVPARGPSTTDIVLQRAVEETAELLCANALLADKEGRRGEALADLARALDVACRVYMIPEHWAARAGERIDMRTFAAFRELASVAWASGEESREVIRAMGAVDFAEVAVKAMLCCQAWEAEGAGYRLGVWRTPPLVLREEAKELRYAAEMVAASRLHPWQCLARAKATFRDPAKGWGQGQQYLLDCILRAWALRDVARVGLALEIYRSAKGEYPAKLDALAPEFLPQVPPDPYTGKPLRYVRSDKGFVVYSVGENLTDDGGLPSTRNWKFDIPWTGGEQSPEGAPGR